MSDNTFPCSPYDEIGGIVHFRRMADKVRLQQAGRLPEDYVSFLGGGSSPNTFDARCCRFLDIRYEDFVQQVRQGLSDEALFAWAIETGRCPTERQKEIWNAFMLKRGWRDEVTDSVQQKAQENGFSETVLTYFDLFDLEEDRTLRYPAEAPLAGVPLPKRPLLSPELRSPYETLGGVVHFPRMLDKIRLHRTGKLPEEWVTYKGAPESFDSLCCEFLGVSHEEIERQVLNGASDEDVLTFVKAQGFSKTEEEIKIFNTYLAKRGTRDQYVERLHFRLGELRLPPRAVSTMFDFIDLDEGREVSPEKPIVF